MPDSAILKFTDPYEHQRAIRAAEVELTVTAPGSYKAELTRIDLHKLWMQRNRTSLPHVARHGVTKSRSVIFFLTGPQRAIHRSGIELSPGDLLFNAPGAEHYNRVMSDCHWAAMSLSPEDLASAGRTLVGHDITAPVVTQRLRPPQHLMSRLSDLHEAAGRLAATAPDILARPEVAKAIEAELVRAMVKCLADGTATAHDARHQRVPVMQRFERALAEHEGRPLYLAELCKAIGVSDRTLRLHCLEHLGMNPHRYLLVRRMNLVRRALCRADRTQTTVTQVATDHGFWELGRFSVAYRKLFGEAPSTTLKCVPDDGRIVPEFIISDLKFPFLP